MEFENYDDVKKSEDKSVCKDNEDKSKEDRKINDENNEEEIINKSEDKLISEGLARIKSPDHVFYNPVQEFNRDLTILVSSRVTQHFCKEKEILHDNKNVKASLKDKEVCRGVRILEALAATGLRSMRFALEVPDVACVVANDYDKRAVGYIEENSVLNNVGHLVTPHCGDASLYMHQSKRSEDRFHLVDLDPYGSPTPFLDAAVQCVADSGVLCITSTDMAVLCGNSPETCLSKYASVSVRTRFCHEMAVRILLRSIESHANRYSRYIIPLLSISVDFYCRVFVQVFTSQKEVKNSCGKLSHLYYCSTCSNHHLQALCNKVNTSPNNYKYVATSTSERLEKCGNCGGRLLIAGPLWSEPIHHRAFVEDLLGLMVDRRGGFKTAGRIEGMLTVVKEELVDVPLYFDSDYLCSVLHCTCISFVAVRSALLNGGYQVSSSHACKNSVKTNAPPGVLWDIMRSFVLENPISKNRNLEGSPAHRILSQPISFKADFTPHPLANPESRAKGMVRWQVNPEKYWGPKPKATRCENKSIKKGPKKHQHQEKAQYMCKKIKLSDCPHGEKCVYKHLD